MGIVHPEAASTGKDGGEVMNDPAFFDYSDGAEELMPDWFDDDFIEAVITVGKGLPSNVVPIAPARAAREQRKRKDEVTRRMKEMAARTRERRAK